MAINLPNIPNFPLAPLILIHLTFTGLAQLHPWLPQYEFSQGCVILVLLWASHDKTSALAAIMYLVALAISIVLDCVSLVYYMDKQTDKTQLWEFSAGMVIMHLIAKPLMGLYAVVVVVARRESLKIWPIKSSPRE